MAEMVTRNVTGYVARRMAAGRSLRRMSQADLVEAVLAKYPWCGWTAGTAGAIENDRRHVRAEELPMIAAALELPIEWFLEDVPPPTPLPSAVSPGWLSAVLLAARGSRTSSVFAGSAALAVAA